MSCGMTSRAEAVAEAVERARVAADYSVNRLADEANIPRPTLTRSLEGARPFTVTDLFRIADVLKTDVREFFSVVAA